MAFSLNVVDVTLVQYVGYAYTRLIYVNLLFTVFVEAEINTGVRRLKNDKSMRKGINV